MLNHPDTAVQYILTTLENQRDNLIIENGNLTARVKELEVFEPKTQPIEVSAEEAPAESEAVS